VREKLLTRFNFDSKRWYDRVDKLSGGERRRLQLLQVLATNPNVLLLDEPSNDLDLQTLQTLEDYLVETFQGMLVIVSHDNFLVNKVADHLFVFEGDGVVRDFQGSYTDYLNVRKRNRVMKGGSGAVEDTTRATGEDPKGSGNAAASKANGKSRSKLTFPEQKEMQKLESAIAKLSAAIAEKEEEVGSEMSIKKGYSHQATLQEEADKMKVEVEEKELRWLELAEKDA
jgi:ATP-binding cassette subfamily F protein uup